MLLHLGRCKDLGSKLGESTLPRRKVASYICKAIKQENKCHVQGKTNITNTKIQLHFFAVKTVMAALPELLCGLASKWREDAPVDQRRSQPDVIPPTHTHWPLRPHNSLPFPKCLQRHSLCIYAEKKYQCFPCWKHQLPSPLLRSAIMFANSGSCNKTNIIRTATLHGKELVIRTFEKSGLISSKHGTKRYERSMLL